MKCPNCGKPMNKNFCIYCGYLTNGNFINKKIHQIGDVEKVLDKDFDKVIRNENKFTVFILGPLYLCYRDFLGLGIIFFFVDMFSYLIIPPLIMLIVAFLFNILISANLTIVLYFIVNRLFWVTCSNMIYLKLLNMRIKRIRKKYKDQADTYISKIKYRNFYKFGMGVFLCIIIPIIILYCYRIINGTL